jgi:hypothetical protein
MVRTVLECTNCEKSTGVFRLLGQYKRVKIMRAVQEIRDCESSTGVYRL